MTFLIYYVFHFFRTIHHSSGVCTVGDEDENNDKQTTEIR